MWLAKDDCQITHTTAKHQLQTCILHLYGTTSTHSVNRQLTNTPFHICMLPISSSAPQSNPGLSLQLHCSLVIRSLVAISTQQSDHRDMHGVTNAFFEAYRHSVMLAAERHDPCACRSSIPVLLRTETKDSCEPLLLQMQSCHIPQHEDICCCLQA